MVALAKSRKTIPQRLSLRDARETAAPARRGRGALPQPQVFRQSQAFRQPGALRERGAKRFSRGNAQETLARGGSRSQS